jgi:hypothetical protein
MLGDREATATVAVKDIAVAKRFYEATPDGNIHSIVNR